jgi:hypothetical protein
MVAVISVCSRTIMAAASVQPEAMSVITKLRVAAADRLATMRHHIHLEEAWWRIVPITERSHGNAFSQQSIVDPRSAPALPAYVANRLQKPIHGCSAH